MKTLPQLTAERLQLKKLREEKLDHIEKLKEAQADAPNKAAKQKLQAAINTQIQSLRHIESRLSVIKTECAAANDRRWKHRQFAQGIAVGWLLFGAVHYILSRWPF